MKQKIYIIGIISLIILFTGAIFKINHLPGANILLTLGVFTIVLIFLPLALANSFKADNLKQNRLLYIVAYITCLVVFTSMLFKIMHWPFAGILLVIALPFPYVVFLPVFLGITSKNKNFNIYELVFVISILAVNSIFSVLLALNVSKSRIEDSYTFSRNFNKVESEFRQIPNHIPKNQIEINIDEAVKTVEDYEALILKPEGLTIEQWKLKPGNLWRPEWRALAAEALIQSGEMPFGSRLSSALNNVIKELEKSKKYDVLAKASPAIFGLKNTGGYDQEWADEALTYNNLAWSMIYLDGLKANLLLIKASLN